VVLAKKLYYTDTMNRPGKRCLVVAASLLLAMPVRASLDETNPTENAYRAIIDRNPFNLKAPADPAPVTPAAEPAKKGELKLTGITSFGRRKAYFMFLDQKSGQQPEYYALGVDEKKDNLEVVDINDISKEVRVRYDGGEMLMTFATHGIMAPAAGVVTPNKGPGIPGVPGGGAQGAPNAAMAPPTTAYSMPASMASAPSSLQTGFIPSRPTRTMTGGMQIDPGLAQRYGLQPTPANVPTPAGQQNGDSAEQVILLELQRAASPNVSLPPTPGLPGQTQPGAPTFPTPTLPGGPPRVR
jgi:hypothetical protein